MITPTRIVLAVGSGYLLGRTKKLRFALVVGGAITGRRLPTSATGLLRMGSRYVAASPELAPLRDAVRGQLLVAGRNAAIAAVGHQMELLTDRLTTRLALLEGSRAMDAEPAAGEPAIEPHMTGEPITVCVPDDVLETEHPPRFGTSNHGQITEGAST